MMRTWHNFSIHYAALVISIHLSIITHSSNFQAFQKYLTSSLILVWIISQKLEGIIIGLRITVLFCAQGRFLRGQQVH
jgi:hypothetical protein